MITIFYLRHRVYIKLVGLEVLIFRIFRNYMGIGTRLRFERFEFVDFFDFKLFERFERKCIFTSGINCFERWM